MPTAPLPPMLATAGDLPAGSGWGYEFKWDGVRAIAITEAGNARFYARSGTEITAAYPELTRPVTAVPDAMFDGEIVALDASGRPSFSTLAERIHIRDPRRAAALTATAPVTYMIFDLLALDGVDLTGQPYARRRETLDALRLEAGNWLCPPVFTDGPATWAAAGENHLEGVVAKRLASVYRPGQRSPEWVKVKADRTAEFVVGGWRPGARTLGALLIGVLASGGGLRYRGRVGGGISGPSERALLAALRPLVTAESPFLDAVSRDDARGATWVRPEVVVEIKYGQMTPDGRLRFPRLLRIRPDLAPADASGI